MRTATEVRRNAEQTSPPSTCVPRRQPDAVLTGEQQHRLPELGDGLPPGDRVQRAVTRICRCDPIVVDDIGMLPAGVTVSPVR
jgi:hypothetical protein